MDLNELRLEIDKIDDELVQLFVQRMDVSARIADYKKENSLPIFVPAREAEKLLDVAQKAGSEMAQYTKVLYSMLFELSRGYQSQRNAFRTTFFERINNAIESTPKLLAKDALLACPGTQDQDAQMVCDKLFGSAPVMRFKNTDGILSAVSSGMCRYGILPLETSKKQIYDLLAEQRLYIIRRFRLCDGRQYLCVSKKLEIYPGADHCSIRMALANRPGALYKVLSRLYTLGINVAGLESKTIPDQSFSAMFYFDLETSVYSEEFVLLMCELDDLCEAFSYLGSYTEVV
jgi:chorismate mutase/prephenate dehydratase